MATSSLQRILFLEAKINFQLNLYLDIWHGLSWLILVAYRKIFTVNCTINTAQD